MSNLTRIAARQPTDTSSPMPVDVARDLLAVVRALEARVAVLEDLLASAIAPGGFIPRPGTTSALTWTGGFGAGPFVNKHSAALSAALRLPTVPDAYGR